MKVLLKYDFPRVLIRKDKSGNDWLFVWCSSDEADETEDEHSGAPVSTWIAIRLSAGELSALIDSRISLGEAVLLHGGPVYIIQATNLREPTSLRTVMPEAVPAAILPATDIAISGRQIAFPEDPRYIDKLRFSIHVASTEISLSNNPISLTSPLTANIQNFLSRAAHSIGQPDRTDVTIPLSDWASVRQYATAEGSLRLHLVLPDASSEKIQHLLSAFKALRLLGSGEPRTEELTEVLRQIGDADSYAFRLLSLVSEADVPVIIQWTAPGEKEGHLMLNKRIAGAALRHITASRKPLPSGVALTVELTPGDIAKLNREVRGVGGMQTLLKEIQGQVKGNKLTLNPSQIERIIRYSQRYGVGGFQSRMQPVLVALRRVGVSFAGV